MSNKNTNNMSRAYTNSKNDDSSIPCCCWTCMSKFGKRYARDSISQQIAAQKYCLFQSQSVQTFSQRPITQPSNLIDVPRNRRPNDLTNTPGELPTTSPEATYKTHGTHYGKVGSIGAATGPLTWPDTFDLPLRPKLVRGTEVSQLKPTTIVPLTPIEAPATSETSDKRSVYQMMIDASQQLREVRRSKLIAQEKAQSLERLESQVLNTLRTLEELRVNPQKPGLTVKRQVPHEIPQEQNAECMTVQTNENCLKEKCKEKSGATRVETMVEQDEVEWEMVTVSEYGSEDDTDGDSEDDDPESSGS